MTLNTTDSKIVYAGDGSTTVFAVPFKFLANGDVTAMVSDDATGIASDWIENTHFTLTGAGVDAGGTLTVLTSPTDHTPQAGQTLVIRRVAAETQGAAFPAGGAFPSATVETALDRLTMLVQQHSESIGRALVVPAADSPDAIGELPPSVARATRFLAFDADGNPIASAGTSANLGPVSSFIDTLLDDADAATARATLGIDGVSGAVVGGDIANGALTLPKLSLTTPSSTAAPIGRSLINGVFSISVASGSLTLAIKTRAGTTDPTPDNPVVYVGRASLASATGSYNPKSITSALSFTVSSGSTLGTSNGAPFRLWIVCFNGSDSTNHLGVINCLSGTDIYPLGRVAVASAAAEGGAGAADSALTFYSDVPHISRPFAVLGYMEWSNGLAAAGTWDTLPDIVEQFGPHTPLPGEEIQSVRSATGAMDTGSTSAVFDNTIPQSGEGKLFLSKAVTPTSKANLLRIEAQTHLSPHSGTNALMGLFRDSGPDALAATETYFGATADFMFAHRIDFEERAPSTGAITYKAICGTGTGTYTFNGINGSAYLGGTLNSYLKVREIMA